MFTKRHFVAIAKVISEAGDMEKGASDAIFRTCLANEFADVFADSNPLFDRHLFIKACEL